jgi:hypothetical protein
MSANEDCHRKRILTGSTPKWPGAIANNISFLETTNPAFPASDVGKDALAVEILRS